MAKSRQWGLVMAWMPGHKTRVPSTSGGQGSMLNVSLAACLSTHQEDQAMQEQCVEESNGTCHLVGENQPPLGSKQGEEWG